MQICVFLPTPRIKNPTSSFDRELFAPNVTFYCRLKDFPIIQKYHKSRTLTFNRGFRFVPQLNTTFADAAMERERAEEEAEPMDWLDSVDPKGLMRQLLDCRKKSAALRGPVAAEEILAKVGIELVGNL